MILKEVQELAEKLDKVKGVLENYPELLIECNGDYKKLVSFMHQQLSLVDRDLLVILQKLRLPTEEFLKSRSNPTGI